MWLFGDPIPPLRYATVTPTCKSIDLHNRIIRTAFPGQTIALYMANEKLCCALMPVHLSYNMMPSQDGFLQLLALIR
jgi:hypothetical protein